MVPPGSGEGAAMLGGDLQPQTNQGLLGPSMMFEDLTRKNEC